MKQETKTKLKFLIKVLRYASQGYRYEHPCNIAYDSSSHEIDQLRYDLKTFH